MNRKFILSLTFIHRWLGLIGGWFCFFLVITGTVSVFDQEISQFMQPQLASYNSDQLISLKSLHTAYDLWDRYSTHHELSFIELPSDRYPFVRVVHSSGHLLEWNNINAQTGEIIQTEATVGGYFFDSLHNNLFLGHGMGDVVVIILSVIFMILIISGTIIHIKHLWQDFCKIRTDASMLRFLLDIHNGIGILFLPFLSVMTISGFLFFAPLYLPFISKAAPNYQSHVEKSIILKSTEPAEVLHSLILTAHQTFSSPPGFILLTPKTMSVMQSDADQLAIMRNYIGFDKKKKDISVNINQVSGWNYTQRILYGIHLIRTGNITLRWIYFIAGMLSAILMACGLVFFSTKRRYFKSEKKSFLLSVIYKIIDAVNVAVILGTAIALISVLWINIILPISFYKRIEFEIYGFWIVLLLSFVTAIYCSFITHIFKAWKYQLIVLILMCLLLPLYGWIKYYPLMIKALTDHNILYLAFQITLIGMGGFLILLYRYLQGKKVF